MFGDQPVTDRVDKAIDSSAQTVKKAGNEYIGNMADNVKSKVAGYNLPTTLGAAGAGVGGVTGAAVGHAMTSSNDEEKKKRN